jgi:hypothetical protein
VKITKYGPWGIISYSSLSVLLLYISSSKRVHFTKPNHGAPPLPKELAWEFNQPQPCGASPLLTEHAREFNQTQPCGASWHEVYFSSSHSPALSRLLLIFLRSMRENLTKPNPVVHHVMKFVSLALTPPPALSAPIALPTEHARKFNQTRPCGASCHDVWFSSSHSPPLSLGSYCFSYGACARI